MADTPLFWIVPTELVKHAASATGFAFLYRWEAQGAEFKPMAKVIRRGGHFVASISFVRPVGPEKQDELVISLVPPIEENGEPGGNGPQELPPLGTDRWTPQRKLAVLDAIRTGLLTPELAQACYGIQAHEIEAWSERYRAYGIRGLAVHQLQAVGP
jgi:hypothetical protein